MLTTTVTPASPRTVVHVAGELDMDTAPQLLTCLHDQLERGRLRLVIDLGELSFCDSRGIATLLTVAKRCHAAGGSMRLRGATGAVARVLGITGVGELLAEQSYFGAAPPAPPGQASPGAVS